MESFAERMYVFSKRGFLLTPSATALNSSGLFTYYPLLKIYHFYINYCVYYRKANIVSVLFYHNYYYYSPLFAVLVYIMYIFNVISICVCVCARAVGLISLTG